MLAPSGILFGGIRGAFDWWLCHRWGTTVARTEGISGHIAWRCPVLLPRSSVSGYRRSRCKLGLLQACVISDDVGGIHNYDSRLSICNLFAY